MNMRRRIRPLALLVAVGVVGATSARAYSVLRRADAPDAPMAGPLMADKTDALVVDTDGDGKADPGDKIRYTVAISNTAGYGGVDFMDTIDANTTLVGGSVNVSPLAFDDSYETFGNTLLDVGTGAASPVVTVASNVLANDTDFLGDVSMAITSHTNPSNGTLSVFNNASGTFTYLPNPGFNGIDTFTYTLTDSGGLTGVGKVTITVSNMVWYVKNNATAGGLGRSTDPFDTLVEAQTASSANHTIYVFQGDGTTTGQSLGIVLKNGQRLVGEGVALTMPASVNGGPNPTTLRAAGSQPLLDNTTAGASGVSAPDVIPTEIVGLSLQGSGNAIDLSLTSGSSGTLAIKNNTIRGAGSEGVDINKAGAGTLTLDFQTNTWNTAGTHTGNGFDARTTAGELHLTFSSNTNILSAATGVLLDGTAGGTLMVTGFSSNTVHQNTVGSGVLANTVRFDASTAAGYQQVSGGVTVIGTSGNGVGASGMVFTNVTGDLDFTDLDIFADSGTGLGISGTAAVNTGAGTGTRVTVASGVAVVEATAGPAVDVSNATVSLPLVSIKSTNSLTTGVSLVNVSDGTTTALFSAGSGSTITNASGTDFNVNGGTATVTYDGTITDDVGQLVSVAGKTADSVTFRGAITDGDDGDGSGVSLTSNTGATISFQGGLVLSTGANPAFAATGGGTVTVCDENPCNPGATGALINKITTTTATALNVASTTIGANNLEFRSISAGTGASGPANGIVLNSTGSSGGLKVKGTGAAGTGGTIQNCTGDGVSLTSTRNAELSWMNLTSNDDAGLYGSLVTNLTITSLSIQNNTNALVEAGLELDNLFGVNAFTGLEVSGSTEDNISVTNDAGPGTGTLTSLDIVGTGGTGSTCRVLNNSTSSGNVGINIQAAGTADMNGVEIDGCFLQGNRTVAIRGDAADTSQLEVTARNNVIIAGAPNQGNQGIEFGAATSAQVTSFDIDNNKVGTDGTTSSPLINTGINVSAGGTSACKMTGHVRNNTVVNAGAGSSGFGIRVFQSSSCVIEANVTNNTVSNVGLDYGLLVEAGGSSGSDGRVDAAVTNNTVSVLSGALDAIRAQARNASTMCARITGNTTTHPNDAGCDAGTTFCGLVIRQANTAAYNLEGSGGSCPAGAQTAAQAEACVESQNSEDSGEAFAATNFTGVATNFCTDIP